MSSVDATDERLEALASRQVDLDGLEEVGVASQRLLSRRPQHVAEDYEQARDPENRVVRLRLPRAYAQDHPRGLRGSSHSLLRCKRLPPPRSSLGVRGARSLVNELLLSCPPCPALLWPVQNVYEHAPIAGGL